MDFHNHWWASVENRSGSICGRHVAILFKLPGKLWFPNEQLVDDVSSKSSPHIQTDPGLLWTGDARLSCFDEASFLHLERGLKTKCGNNKLQMPEKLTTDCLQIHGAGALHANKHLLPDWVHAEREVCVCVISPRGLTQLTITFPPCCKLFVQLLWMFSNTENTEKSSRLWETSTAAAHHCHMLELHYTTRAADLRSEQHKLPHLSLFSLLFPPGGAKS